MDAAGDVYVAFGTVASVIRKIDTNQIITTVAGTGLQGFTGDSGPATKATLDQPEGLDFDGAGNLWFADSQNHAIRMITAAGGIATIAGNGKPGYSGDGGAAYDAQLNQPEGLRVFAPGTSQEAVYFSDTGNNRVRRIRRLGVQYVIDTAAGNGSPGYSGDGGQATSAALNYPLGLAFDSSGVLYIADHLNSVVRAVTPAGIISTAIGNGIYDFSGDGGPARQASLKEPYDVTFDPGGNLLISDFYSNRIREVLTAAPTAQVAPAALAFTAPAIVTATGTLHQQFDSPGLIAAITPSATWLSVTPSAAQRSRQFKPPIARLTAGTAITGTVEILAPSESPQVLTVPVTFAVTQPGAPQRGCGASGAALPVSRGRARSLANVVDLQRRRGHAHSECAKRGRHRHVAFGHRREHQRWPLRRDAASDPGQSGGIEAGNLLRRHHHRQRQPAREHSGSGHDDRDGHAPVDSDSAIRTDVFRGARRRSAASARKQQHLNAGQGQMSWSTSVSTQTGGDWLTAFPTNGSTDASSPSAPPQIRVNVFPGTLPAGIYFGSVQVTSPAANNSPQIVSVVLNLLPPGSRVGPLVQPAGMIFVAADGGESPGSQAVLVQSLNTAPLTFTAGVSTSAGGNWLTVLPPGGTVTTGAAVSIVVQPIVSGLAPGVYEGALTLSFSDGSTRAVRIVFVVVAAPLAPSYVRSPCPGGRVLMLVVFTQLSTGSAVSVGFPGQVAVQVVDDCGNPLLTGNVTATFSSGDPPIVLTSLNDGNWAATWTPEFSAAQAIVTATAVDPSHRKPGWIPRIAIGSAVRPAADCGRRER